MFVSFQFVTIDRLSMSALAQILDTEPAEYFKIRKIVYAAATNHDGFIACAHCQWKGKMRRKFEIDHIVPMSRGGLTTSNNLQVLCKSCHIKKTGKEAVEDKAKNQLESIRTLSIR